jgi:hypothetical protein
MHTWVVQAAGWWNRVTARPAGDLVRDCLKESVAKHERTWGAAWVQVMDGLGAAFGDAVRASGPLPIASVRSRLRTLWVEHACADALRFAGTPVRAIPDTESAGFTLATFMNRFYCTPCKGESYVYHVHRPQRVQALARFRLGSHGLNIDAGRRRAGVRVPRVQRTCQCCVLGEIEDELHLVQCPLYIDIRRSYIELFAGYPNVHTWDDAMFRRFMHRGNNRNEWNQLADMLIGMFARRENMLAIEQH